MPDPGDPWATAAIAGLAAGSSLVVALAGGGLPLAATGLAVGGALAAALAAAAPHPERPPVVLRRPTAARRPIA